MQQVPQVDAERVYQRWQHARNGGERESPLNPRAPLSLVEKRQVAWQAVSRGSRRAVHSCLIGPSSSPTRPGPIESAGPVTAVTIDEPAP